MRRVSILLSTLVLLGGCVEREPALSPADRERLREFVSTEAPSPDHELNVHFDNGLTLLGYDASPDEVRPGQSVTVTWYWHVTRDLDDGWKMFTHIADGSGENRLNQDNVGVVRELYPPGRWEPGEYITDRQQITIPEDWGTGGEDGEGGDHAIFYLGLWNGPDRLGIESGPNDGENRARALSLPIQLPASARAAQPSGDEAGDRPAPPPSMRATHAEGDVEIDGEIDDAWDHAGQTGVFVSTLDGSDAPFRAGARMMWDEDNLYVAVEVTDPFVKNDLEGRDAHLWEQDAVELMVDPGGDGRNYFELQVSPTGQVFDTRYDTRRQPQPFGHVDWNSGLRAAVDVRGTANDELPDEGYTVEMAIPWSAFAAGEPPASAPSAGETWKMNLYVMDAQQGEAPQRSAGWSPTLEGDFHVPARFGRVTFAPAPQAAAQGTEGAPAPGTPMQVVPAQQLNPAAVRALREQIARRQANRGVQAPPPTPREAVRGQQGAEH